MYFFLNLDPTDYLGFVVSVETVPMCKALAYWSLLLSKKK